MPAKGSSLEQDASGSALLSAAEAAAAWSQRAEELARWVLARLVVRHDVWGGYVREEQRGKTYERADGTTDTLGATLTRPARSKRGQVFLTEDVVIRHFRSRNAADVIGLHTTSPENTCRWGGIDVDQHGAHSPDATVNWRAARHWYTRLVDRGFRPLLTDSNGAGGFHLHVLLAEEVPAPRLYYFLRGLVADYARLGLPARPETFPKQARIRPGKYGNWVRVPGRHHSRAHWARVWDGESWREGSEAVAYLLALSGDAVQLLPEDAERDARVRAYLARLPNLAEGYGRDDVAFTLLA
jgi:putative DNA primase/helicase